MTPIWLYNLFGVFMLAVAGYAVVLLVVTVAARRPAGWDVDVAHTLMGVSMAGMFVGGWAFGSRLMWELIFAVLLVWFLARSALSIRQFGVHLPHFLVHGVLSLAMILMYAFPGVASDASMGSMSMSMSMSMPMSGGSRLDPAVALVLALCFFASAVFTIGSSKKGASHHGSHVLAYAGVNGGRAPQDDSKRRSLSRPFYRRRRHDTLGRGRKPCRNVCGHGISPHSHDVRDPENPYDRRRPPSPVGSRSRRRSVCARKSASEGERVSAKRTSAASRSSPPIAKASCMSMAV